MIFEYHFGGYLIIIQRYRLFAIYLLVHDVDFSIVLTTLIVFFVEINMTQ